MGLAGSSVLRGTLVYEARKLGSHTYIEIQARYLVTEVPHQSTLRTKTRLNAFHHHNKMRDIYTKTLHIDKAMAAIQRGEFIHYANAIKYYKCSRNAVS
jgi:hypothetical protein